MIRNIKTVIISFLFLLPFVAFSQPFMLGDPSIWIASQGSAPAVPSVISSSYITFVSSGVDSSSYSFSGVSIGAADSGRTVWVFIGSRRLGSTEFTVSSVTIGGITATRATGTYGTDAVPAQTLGEWWYAAVPTGTTGDIDIVLNNSTLRCGIAVYRVIGFSSLTSSVASTSNGSAMNNSITGVANGVILAGACVGGLPTWAWTNITEDFEEQIGAEGAVSSGGRSTSTGSISITATPTTTTSAGALAIVALSPNP